MIAVANAPYITAAERTGYITEGEFYETQVPVWETEDGVMTREELISYMINYIRTNTEDAALALLGIENTYITVECDAYGDPL